MKKVANRRPQKVISDTKNPACAGFQVSFLVAYRRCHRGAALPSMSELSEILSSYQRPGE